MKDIYYLLKRYFGYDSFRNNQEQIIRSLIEGQDVLAVMPTGAGKSICYQVPALALEGITLVISPLVSLMQDQVRNLIANGIRGAYINSSLTPGQIKLALRNASAGMYKIIYAAPERLLSPEFLKFAVNADISLIAVDEAHCISQWGQDFRPGYLKIADFIERLPHRPPVAALTATATRQVKQDIQQQLSLIHPLSVTGGFDRPNLYFGIYRPVDSVQFIIRYIESHPDDCGIIYCATRKDTEVTAEELILHGINARPYHAGLDDTLRKNTLEDFTYDRIKVIAATSAFGMGIDKPDVRFVIHQSMPQNIEDYYQQAGRAGRDGAPSDCILLYNSSDPFLQEFLIKRRKPNDALSPEQQQAVLEADLEKVKQMTFYATSASVCLRRRLLQYFGEKYPGKCRNCSVCSNDILEHCFGSVADFIQRTDDELLSRLRTKAKFLAVQRSIPVYAVASDAMLKELSAVRPKNEAALRTINGFSEEKIRKYGKEFLDVIQNYDSGNTGKQVGNQ